MEVQKIVLSFALLVVCAIAVQGNPIISPNENNANVEEAVPESQVNPDFQTNSRAKRYIPYAQTYSIVPQVYSYLQPYSNAISGVHYGHPVITAPIVTPILI
ncbi:hypothetical protein PGB90_008175 [Kerria lacca]